MGTYNTYLNKQASIGEHTPIWLGFVVPAAVGGNLASSYAKAGAFFPAGTPFELKDGIATPFLCWELSAVDSSSHILTVKANELGYVPAVGDALQVVGATFATTGAAGIISAIAVNATDATKLDITMTTSALDGASEGAIISLSSATAAGSSGKSLKVQPTHYLYNDVKIDDAVAGVTYSNIAASVALVNFHGAGLLVNRTPSAPVKSQMKAAVPNVIQDARF